MDGNLAMTNQLEIDEPSLLPCPFCGGEAECFTMWNKAIEEYETWILSELVKIRDIIPFDNFEASTEIRNLIQRIKK